MQRFTHTLHNRDISLTAFVDSSFKSTAFMFAKKSCLHNKKNMFSSTIDWELGNVQTNSKGIRSAPLTNSDGSPVFLQLTDAHSPLIAPFGSSAFNDPTAIRHNICFRCDQSLEDKSNTLMVICVNT